MFANLIIKGRRRIVDLTGHEPEVIYVPITQSYLDWLLSSSEVLQYALTDFSGQITNAYPPMKLLPLIRNQTFEETPRRSNSPVSGLTVFTDAGKKSKRAVVTWCLNGQWHSKVLNGVLQDSLQTLELRAVVWAFQNWQNEPINVVSDSMYVVGTVMRLERSMLRSLRNSVLYQLLLQLLHLLNQRTYPYFIVHIRSHQPDYGLAIGNNRADHLVAATWENRQTNLFEQARVSHEFFHQLARVLARQFNLPISETCGIVQSCPDCQGTGFGLGLGVNPRGLHSLQLWQMDVTHVPEFGGLKYVHVSIDTYSHAIWATAQTGEMAKHVIKHMCAAIAVLGVPQEIKTDNGPAYVSQRFAKFCTLWGIRKHTGIPHSPTGQAIVERAHTTLKALLQKQKGGEITSSSAERLAKALDVLNCLRLTGERDSPPIVIHHMSLRSGLQATTPGRVQYKDWQSGQWKGPVEIKMIGRRYACVLTDQGPRWVPARWIKPWREPKMQESGTRDGDMTT